MPVTLEGGGMRSTVAELRQTRRGGDLRKPQSVTSQIMCRSKYGVLIGELYIPYNLR